MEVHEGDQPVTVGTVKARTLLAALLLRANRVVPIDEGRMRQRYVNGRRKVVSTPGGPREGGMRRA